MKTCFGILLLFTINLYGQAPLDLNVYLNNNKISKAAKDYYAGKFKATDNSKTFSIIDSLKTKNDIARPFYIFLVSKIIDKSDGSLSEAVGISCKDFIESHPDNLIDFLFSENKIVDPRFIDNWAKQIAGEFMIDCEGTEQSCVKKSLDKVLVKSRKENRPKLTLFYQKVSKYCH